VGHTFLKRHRISETDPLSAQTEVVQRTIMRRPPDWSVRVETRTRLTSTRDTFQFSADLETFENEDPAAHRTWQITVPRASV
jgi:hypothetical protein